jgi:phospholipid/cholesterol/gamma-HCH transport system substrate-binding protein
MKNTLETRLGVFFALTAIVAVIVLEMVGIGDYFKPGYKAFALFKNAQDLKDGDLVKMAGVEVGRVSKISLTNDLVCVTMKIKNTQAEIRTTSKAAIRFTGLMGQNFVALDFGTPDGAPARDGCTFTTYEQPDLGSLMAKLQDVASSVQGLAKGFTPENLAPLFGPITDFLKMNTNNLSVILGNSRTATDELAQGKGTAGRLLSDDSLYNSALAAVTGIQASVSEIKPMLSQFRMTLDNVQTVVADIKEGHGTVGKLVTDESLYRETTMAMSNLREIFEKINRGQGTVGELVNTNSFLKNAKVTLQKLDKATEGLEDQGPISVIGIMAGQLF